VWARDAEVSLHRLLVASDAAGRAVEANRMLGEAPDRAVGPDPGAVVVEAKRHPNHAFPAIRGEVLGIDQPALVLAHPYEEGFVTMADVFGLTLDADFVAILACNTGEGAREPG
jgi:hypothetical protein